MPALGAGSWLLFLMHVGNLAWFLRSLSSVWSVRAAMCVFVVWTVAASGVGTGASLLTLWLVTCLPLANICVQCAVSLYCLYMYMSIVM